MKASNQKQLSQLAQRIRAARIASHLSQSDLAQGIGVSDKSVSSYEQGRSIPPFEKLKKIAESTKHPINYFTDDNATYSIIAQKLTTIERELAEIKKLFKEARK
jgi:transcriptional regulator with XRE-family HTH domain